MDIRNEGLKTKGLVSVLVQVQAFAGKASTAEEDNDEKQKAMWDGHHVGMSEMKSLRVLIFPICG